MARIRSLHPGLATDELFMEMTLAAKAAWPLVWTECDDHGVFEYKPRVLKARLLPADNVDFDDLLMEWERVGVIRTFEHEGKRYGTVRNFCRWQRPKKPAYRHPLPNEFRTFVGLTASSGEPVPNQFPTGGEISQQREEVGSRREEVGGKSEQVESPPHSHQPQHQHSIAEDFDRFWAAYPAREGSNPRGRAVKQFANAVATGVDPETIIKGALAYAHAQRDLAGTRFIPHAANWLGRGEWEDFAHCAAPAADAARNRAYHFTDDDPRLRAWERYSITKRGKGYPRDRHNGWTFPSEWPPGHDANLRVV